MGIIMDGKGISARIKEEMKEKIKTLKAEKNINPGLAVITYEENKPSLKYLENIEHVCSELGIVLFEHIFDNNMSEDELLDIISDLNSNDNVHGIMLHMPLPKGFDANRITSAIDPQKDIDCLNSTNMGKLIRGEKCLLPCTPKGIMRLLAEYKIDIEGKRAVVVGRSNPVGKPVAVLLLNKNATVVICHSKTMDLAKELKGSDIIVCAAGIPGLVTDDMVKEGAVVVDVGISVVDGHIVGDVDYAAVLSKASYITPVPGGVGSMTTTMLMENVLEATGYYE